MRHGAALLEPIEPLDALDLPTIDLGSFANSTWTGAGSGMPFDRRTYEERYAELGFGLGVVPRKLRRDDAWWETPVGMLAMLAGVLLLLLLLATGS